MKINRLAVLILISLIILYIYKIIFSTHIISGGDYLSISIQQLIYWKDYPFTVWNGLMDLGWGIIPLLSYAPYSLLMGSVGSIIHGSVVAERAFWWGPFLLLGFVSSWTLFRRLFGSNTFSFLAPFIYLCNTYILLIITGGQIAGIGQAYAFAPLVIHLYIDLSQKPTWLRAVLTGIGISVSTMFDLRMTYVLLAGIGVYLLLKIISLFITASYMLDTIFKNILLIVFIPGFIAVLLHAYWLIPMAIVHQNPLLQLGAAYDSAGAVKFFSFATFENTLSLLHPNWPENIFGKIYFMRPEFLLLPVLAFSSLFFINGKRKTENDDPASHELRKGKEKRLPLDSTSLTIAMTDENLYVIFFALLGLLGAFLAKGANDPFGGIYLWLFAHVPGFVMFRDPTKWYLLIAISYSMLIPYTVGKVYDRLSKITENK